jgi:hypothetical protein
VHDRPPPTRIPIPPRPRSSTLHSEPATGRPHRPCPPTGHQSPRIPEQPATQDQHFNSGRSTPDGRAVCPDLPHSNRPPCLTDRHPRASHAFEVPPTHRYEWDFSRDPIEHPPQWRSRPTPTRRPPRIPKRPATPRSTLQQPPAVNTSTVVDPPHTRPHDLPHPNRPCMRGIHRDPIEHSSTVDAHRTAEQLPRATPNAAAQDRTTSDRTPAAGVGHGGSNPESGGQHSNGGRSTTHGDISQPDRPSCMTSAGNPRASQGCRA